jgi:spore photoproduct lyase
MEQSFDPHGKLTYSDEIKTRLFQAVYESLRPWHGKVFFYLCMEKAEIWESVFGWAYGSNEEFEQDFGRQVMP